MIDQDPKPASQTREESDGWGFDAQDRVPDAGPTTDYPSETEPGKDGKKRPSAMREIIETIVLAALIFVLVRSVVLNYRVDGHSMDPSLADNEMLFVNRNAYLEFDKYALVDWLPFVDHKEEDTVRPFGGPERGDIIVLTPPIDGSTKPYIKRVIGLPGDTIDIRDNKVFVNGIELVEPYIDGERTFCNGQPGRACPEYTVPEGYVFVLGDNRDNSEDSRMIGMIPEENIIGKAWFTYWPTDYFGPVPHEDYPELTG
jgi:signal peptidase I